MTRAGNLLHQGACGTADYTWDAENRITTTAGVTYGYDGDGERVSKSSGTLYWGSGPLAESDASGNITAEYIFFGGKRIARRDANGTVHYYFADHLGSADVVTSATGTIENESDYYPWGGERPVVQSLADQHYKFTGKERDTESGLDYFGARYYANPMGRWLSPDWSATPQAVPYADLTDPQTLNLYGYVRGNPLNRADIDGHGWWQDIKTAAINTFNNVGTGFVTLVLEPDQALRGAAESFKNAAQTYGTSEGRAQLGGVDREMVLESVMTSTASVAPGSLGAAAGGNLTTLGVSATEDVAAAPAEATVAGTNQTRQLTSRSSLREGTVQAAWDNAPEGPNGGRLCPTCSREVHGNPGAGEARGGQWDVHHDPHWTERQFSPNASRQQVIDNYQEGTSLRCVRCNRSDNQPHPPK